MRGVAGANQVDGMKYRDLIRQLRDAKMNPVEYTVIIEPADDGTFSVYVPDLPGCVSTGRTRDEAIESIREAIQGHVQTLRDLGQDVPPPRSQSQVVAA
jgi:predicted RNase H-like HicB family nuclease